MIGCIHDNSEIVHMIETHFSSGVTKNCLHENPGLLGGTVVLDIPRGISATRFERVFCVSLRYYFVLPYNQLRVRSASRIYKKSRSRRRR